MEGVSDIAVIFQQKVTRSRCASSSSSIEWLCPYSMPSKFRVLNGNVISHSISREASYPLQISLTKLSERGTFPHHFPTPVLPFLSNSSAQLWAPFLHGVFSLWNCNSFRNPCGLHLFASVALCVSCTKETGIFLKTVFSSIDSWAITTLPMRTWDPGGDVCALKSPSWIQHMVELAVEVDGERERCVSSLELLEWALPEFVFESVFFFGGGRFALFCFTISAAKKHLFLFWRPSSR